jgi:DNA-binding LytR/AlgR family response regulator
MNNPECINLPVSHVHIGAWKEVKPQEVMLLEADINYTKVYFRNGKKMTVATSLKELEHRFNTFQFFRTHKSYLVNLDFVEEYKRDTLIMTNNVKVNLARRRRTAFKQIWFNSIYQ